MTRHAGGVSVLDASALLALLRRETGAERVAKAVQHGALVSAVNWAEVMARLIDIGADPGDIAGKTLPPRLLGDVALVPFDAEQACETARLRVRTRSLHLSLADRAALALARLRSLPVLTTDRAWRSLRLGIAIDVIR